MYGVFFFFNDTATTEIYTLSLHDALPISAWLWTITVRSNRFHLRLLVSVRGGQRILRMPVWPKLKNRSLVSRSEEHTSELQSPCNLVCRLLLEKKKMIILLSRCSHCPRLI